MTPTKIIGQRKSVLVTERSVTQILAEGNEQFHTVSSLNDYLWGALEQVEPQLLQWGCSVAQQVVLDKLPGVNAWNCMSVKEGLDVKEHQVLSQSPWIYECKMNKKDLNWKNLKLSTHTYVKYRRLPGNVTISIWASPLCSSPIPVPAADCVCLRFLRLRSCTRQVKEAPPTSLCPMRQRRASPTDAGKNCVHVCTCVCVIVCVIVYVRAPSNKKVRPILFHNIIYNTMLMQCVAHY